MTVALVQDKANWGDGVSTVTVTLDTDATEGNLLVASCNAPADQRTFTAPASWVSIQQSRLAATPFPQSELFAWVAGASPGAAFQFDLSGSSDFSVIVAEFSSSTGWEATPKDVSDNLNDESTSPATSQNIPTAGGITTTQNDELLIAWIATNQIETTGFTTWGSSFTQNEEVINKASIYASQAMAYRIVAATSTYSTSVAWTTSARHSGGIAGFKVSAAASNDLTGSLTGTSTITVSSLSLSQENVFTLIPNGDQTRDSVINEQGATINLYQSIDDDPDSPDLSDYVFTQGVDGSMFFDLSATPGDFSAVTSLEVRADIRKINISGYTVNLYAQVFDADELTDWTDEVVVATEGTSDGLVEASYFTINATGLAATKGEWDTARVKLRWDYT